MYSRPSWRAGALAGRGVFAVLACLLFWRPIPCSEFFFDVKEMVQVAIADPVWGEKLLEYGITQDVIDENIGKAYVRRAMLPRPLVLMNLAGVCR